MKINDKTIMIISFICMVLGTGILYMYNIEPGNKDIAKIKEGDFVVIDGIIQSMGVYKDEYNHIQKIKYIKIRDNTGGDLRIVAFDDVNNDLTNYIKSTTPTIKEGDKIEVIGTISVYNGIYAIVLKDIGDFKLIKKENYEKDIYLSPNPTNIWASKSSKLYHINPNCPYGKKIKDGNRKYFYCEQDAIDLGYNICKWCSKN
ncbi:hypothetical protein [Methanococcus aeolicus]|nr:hypothetical protein [Methanococcus aeolicus]